MTDPSRYAAIGPETPQDESSSDGLPFPHLLVDAGGDARVERNRALFLVPTRFGELAHLQDDVRNPSARYKPSLPRFRLP
jgi:hypothetical protein